MSYSCVSITSRGICAIFHELEEGLRLDTQKEAAVSWQEYIKNLNGNKLTNNTYIYK